MSLLELFCHVDDCCQSFVPHWQREQLASGLRLRRRTRGLSLSEVMTILIHFHQSHYRDFKAFYTQHVLQHLRAEFPALVSYTRFVEFILETLIPLCVYLRVCCGACTSISFVDSTTLAVCHNRRIHASCVARLHRAALCKSTTQDMHKVFAGLAARGKSSLGWFYGFKLHLVFNGLKTTLTEASC